ncbi:hypothetical protein NDU88_010698 [Pleurodeles waltl]|uniref:Uncharacterized protein n=1 Tax=Pleurodeles waltl TaxID=8319 RepID=A0AAV7QX41_PLEWA|nr:hypothetical protein NDU88_010698 [Pleurodeles waltl]
MGQGGRIGSQLLGGQPADAPGRLEQEPASQNATLTNAKLDQILEAITVTRQDLGAQVDAVAAELGLLRDDQRKLANCITHAKNNISEMRPSVSELTGQVRVLTAKMQELED